MDLTIYQTNSEKELALKKDYRAYFNSGIAVTMFMVLAFCLLSSILSNLFPITLFNLIPFIFISLWFCIPFSLSFIYWYKFFDRKIKLLINEKGIGFSSTFFDNLSLHKLRTIFKHDVASITSDGIGYKQNFFDWNEIIHFQFVIVTTPNKLTSYLLELRIKCSDEPIIIYLPDKEIATFERVKVIISDYAKEKGTKDLGLVQKSIGELSAQRLHFQAFKEKPIQRDVTHTSDAKTKSELEDIKIYSSSNIPRIIPLANTQDASVAEVSKVIIPRITPLSHPVENVFEGNKNSIIKITISVIASVKSIKKFLFPPKVVEKLGDFIVKRGAINGCMIALLLPFFYVLFGAITVAFPEDLLGNFSEGFRTILMFLFQISCIYLTYRIYSHWKGTVLLRINKESISNGVVTYYWKDISSFRYQIKFKSIPQKGGGYVNTVDHTNLQLYDKENEYCGYIRIEMSGWDKTITEIRTAIFAVTDGHGIEDLGSVEDISEIKNY